ncbi:hypothetical protein GPALN_015596, partial [Globodera pallida]
KQSFINITATGNCIEFDDNQLFPNALCDLKNLNKDVRLTIAKREFRWLDETVKTLRRGQKITHKEGGKWEAPVAQLEELPTDWVQDVAPDGCPTVASEAIDQDFRWLDETVKTLRRGQKITHKEGGKWDAPVAQLEELPTDWVQDVGLSLISMCLLIGVFVLHLDARCTS